MDDATATSASCMWTGCCRRRPDSGRLGAAADGVRLLDRPRRLRHRHRRSCPRHTSPRTRSSSTGRSSGNELLRDRRPAPTGAGAAAKAGCSPSTRTATRPGSRPVSRLSMVAANPTRAPSPARLRQSMTGPRAVRLGVRRRTAKHSSCTTRPRPGSMCRPGSGRGCRSTPSGSNAPGRLVPGGELQGGMAAGRPRRHSRREERGAEGHRRHAVRLRRDVLAYPRPDQQYLDGWFAIEYPVLDWTGLPASDPPHHRRRMCGPPGCVNTRTGQVVGDPAAGRGVLRMAVLGRGAGGARRPPATRPTTRTRSTRTGRPGR